MTNVENNHPTEPAAASQPNPNGGPRTEAGKEISSQNSTRHGCCSLSISVLATENVADLQALADAWKQTYAPQTPTEIHLVEQLIAADWLLRRSNKTFGDVEASLFAMQPNPLLWSASDHQALTRFQRYRTANQNAFTKQRRVVEDHFKTRANEKRQAEKMEIAQERLQVFKAKNKPQPTWEEEIETMRQQAIALGFRLPDPPKL